MNFRFRESVMNTFMIKLNAVCDYMARGICKANACKMLKISCIEKSFKVFNSVQCPIFVDEDKVFFIQ